MKVYTDTQPFWADAASFPTYPRLERDEAVDVVIIGAGITGLTAAYLLTLEGRSVAVLERERCAAIDTGHTSAHLTMVTDVRMTDLVRTFGRDHAQATWDAGLAALGQIAANVVDLEIPCDFAWVPGFLHAPIGASNGQRAAFEKEFQEEAAAASELGFDASFVADVPFVGGPGVRYEDQARFHPRKYLVGLAQAIVDRGGLIFEHSAVEEFGDRPVSVKANGRTIICQSIVLATHTPLVGNASMLGAALFQTKLALYTSCVVSGRARKGRVPDALFWDSADPYHYLRIEPHADHDVVIFGGEDHKTGQADEANGCFDRLERTLHSMNDGIDVTHRWSGQVIETPDGLPYIGETATRQFAGTGFSGNGMTFGTLTAMMAADRVAGRTNPWTDLFDPGRKKIAGGVWNYIKENLDYPYYRIRDRFAGAEARSTRAVPRGSGKVIEIDGEKVAVYRDARGAVSKRSAVCTHLSCTVSWNDAEKTWDCPCHGSRFKPGGKVIAGPAEAPLPPYGRDKSAEG
jgi:glycine/D-amino acid oxidase-like deaminating enzyme/nitrite reductase/ring-hydroxylating ferredoxin subunit